MNESASEQITSYTTIVDEDTPAPFPLHPQQQSGPERLTLRIPDQHQNHQGNTPQPSSATGPSSHSMRTSSFAMSDESETYNRLPSPQYESLSIRQQYAQPPRKSWHYHDEKDFRNTDRYGFLRVQSSNCEPPEVRHMAAVPAENGSSKKFGNKQITSSVRRKLLSKAKDDILNQPKKVEETKMTEKELERTMKWRDMALIDRPNGSICYSFPLTKKLVQRTFKGIPDCWRATVWHEFLNSQAAKRGNRESEHELIKSYYRLSEQDCGDDAQIDLDVPRTISEHIFFRQRYGEGQRLLFQVLHCISLKFPNHGYVQGMAPIAATLLCYYPDEIAFVILVRLWQDKGLKNFFSQEFDGLMTAFKSLEDTLKHRSVGKKLTSLGIDPPSYATRWYLTLFNYSLPFHTQLRIWDALMISDDGPGMLHATALALLNGMADRLRNTDFERAMKLITTRIDVKDDDKLMHLVFKEAVKNGALKFDF